MPGADDQQNLQPGADASKTQNPSDSGNQGGDGSFGSLEDAMKEIKRLRQENAGHRTKNKTLEESLTSFNDKFTKINKHLGIQDQVDPEEQIKGLSSNNEQLTLELSLQQLARVNGIPMEQDEYFRFLIGKKFEALKDGEEISDEQISEVVAEVGKYSGFKKDFKTSTGLGDGKTKNPPASDSGKETVTTEQFSKMTFAQKNQLFEENKELYNKLSAASRRR